MVGFAPRFVGCCVLWLVVSAGASGEEIEVRDAWIRQPPPGASAAAYMTLANRGEVARALTAVRSDAAQRIELHRTSIEGGVARMQRVDSIEIPAGGEVALEPRGLHLMLLEPQALSEGDEVEIVLELDGDEYLAVQVPVRRQEGGAHHHP